MSCPTFLNFSFKVVPANALRESLISGILFVTGPQLFKCPKIIKSFFYIFWFIYQYCILCNAQAGTYR